jgi:hypothetical protein
MPVNKDQVKKLLGTGLTPEIVGSAVGCDPSYISQLMADDAFAQEVAVLRMSALTANNERDKNIDGIEDNLITALRDAVETKQIYKPREILQAFAVVNSAKRRGIPAREAAVVNNTIVTLNMPVQVIKNYTINGGGEVVGVDKETLVTMPTNQLLNQLAEGKDGKRYEDVKRILPQATLQIERKAI